jgi:hypothetical protein
MIVEYVIQNPGQMEQNTTDYRGYKKKTIVFLDDWVNAQFLEVGGKLIENWSDGDTAMALDGQPYASMNVSLIPRKFMVIYHNDDFEYEIKTTVVNNCDDKFGSSATSGTIKLNPDSGQYEIQC